MSDKIKDWEIKIMALIKKLELRAYRIGKTGNKDEESVSPNKREIVGYVQELLDKREEEVIKELCVIAGIREVNDRQFHIILKEYNNKKELNK